MQLSAHHSELHVVYHTEVTSVSIVNYLCVPGVVSHGGHDGAGLCHDWGNHALLYGVCGCSQPLCQNCGHLPTVL